MKNNFGPDLTSQDISSLHSRTTRMCSEVMFPPDMFDGSAGGQVSLEDAQMLEGVRPALVAAYGLSKHARMDITKRNAPSAGGRYPIELLVLMSNGGSFKLFHYDAESDNFLERQAYSTRTDITLNLEHASKIIGLENNQIAVILAAVLWRTVERYGIRGYRYCLIEAGYIASRIAEELRIGTLAMEPSKRRLDEYLGLNCSTPSLGICRISHTPINTPDIRPPLPVAPNKVIKEQAPILSPRLTRAEQFHQRSLADTDNRHLPLIRALEAHSTKTRESARDFSGGALDAQQRRKISDVLDYHVRSNPTHRHLLRIVILTINENQTFAREVDLFGFEENTHTLPANCGSVTTIVQRVFQNQTLITRAGILVLIGTSSTEGATLSHREFTLRCMAAGILMADLYRVATINDIGTTTIGGFSDQGVRDLLTIPDFFPLIAQVYGEAHNPSVKDDAKLWQSSASQPHFRVWSELDLRRPA